LHFDLIQSLSLAGNAAKPNDDRAGCTAQLAWVIDGATDLGPPGLVGDQGGAAWLASATNCAFNAAEPPLERACASVFTAIERRFLAERRRVSLADWELPSAALMAVAIEGPALAYASAGDCCALLRQGGEIRWLGDTPDRLAESADAAAVGSGAMHLPEVVEDRRRARGRVGRRVLGVDAAASAASMTDGTAQIARGDELLLMSDGFSALVDAYRAHAPETLFAALAPRGLAALATELRAIEQADAACTRFPRFKRSDDATALWLRIG
jgi:serine/threonine protein phosphatase PrpC